MDVKRCARFIDAEKRHRGIDIVRRARNEGRCGGVCGHLKTRTANDERSPRTRSRACSRIGLDALELVDVPHEIGCVHTSSVRASRVACPRARPTHALRTRRFASYLAAAACADTGFWISTVASGWLVLTLTNSPFWLGTIAASGQLPYLLFSFYGGTLADRFDRRTLVAGGNAILLALALALAALIATGHVTLATLAILSFAIGTIIALEHPVDRAWLYDLVRGEELGRAIALSSLEWSVARTLGPAFGGIAIATVGVAVGFAVFAVSLVPMIALALVLGRKSARRDEERADEVATFVAPRVSRLEAVVVPFSLLIAAFTIGITPYITLLPDIAKNILHLDVRGYGILSACGGGGAIVGALVLAKIGEIGTKGRVIPIAMFASAIALIAFTFVRDVTVAGIMLFVIGAIDTLMYALANTYVQECAGDEERGRANGLFSLAFLGGIPIGNFAIGSLASAIGTERALVAAAVGAGCVCVIFWFGAPGAREAA